MKPGASKTLQSQRCGLISISLAKAAQQVSGKDALEISNTAQLRDICLAAARIFGWTGDSQVNVAVNNQVNVVCNEEDAAGTDRATAEAARSPRHMPTSAPGAYRRAKSESRDPGKRARGPAGSG
jgi:hypothetical protein